MTLVINDKEYNVIIRKKSTTKNLYIRVDNDLNIVITCNIFTSNRQIEKVLKENVNSIYKMINKQNVKNDYKSNNYFLGKKFDIVYINENKVIVGENKLFIGKNIDIDKWYKKQAKVIFQERLDYNYDKFTRRIPYPKLCIRSMKTRWGVCNYKDNKVTLNLELIKKDINCLDYVINHELSHFIHHNHSKDFWSLVEENFKDYKKIRKQMKDY